MTELLPGNEIDAARDAAHPSALRWRSPQVNGWARQVGPACKQDGSRNVRRSARAPPSRVPSPSGSPACRSGSAPSDRPARSCAAACSARDGGSRNPPARRDRSPVPARGWIDRRHLLAPALVGRADDDGVVDRRCACAAPLHLLGIDLLAAGVDAHRAAAEHVDRSVGVELRVIARHRVAHAFNGRGRFSPSSPGPCSTRAARVPCAPPSRSAPSSPRAGRSARR